MKLNFKFFIAGLIVGSIGLTAVSGSEGISSVVFNKNKIIFEGTEIKDILNDPILISVTKDGENFSTDYGRISPIMEDLGFRTNYDEKNDIITINKNEFYEPKFGLNPAKTKSYNPPVQEEQKVPIYNFPEPVKNDTVKNSNYEGPQKVSESSLDYFGEQELKDKLINSSWKLQNFEYIITFYEDGSFVHYFMEVNKQPSVYVGTYTISGTSVNVKYDTGYNLDNDGNVISFCEYPQNAVYSARKIDDNSNIYMTMGISNENFFEYTQIPVIQYYQKP